MLRTCPLINYITVLFASASAVVTGGFARGVPDISVVGDPCGCFTLSIPSILRGKCQLASTTHDSYGSDCGYHDYRFDAVLQQHPARSTACVGSGKVWGGYGGTRTCSTSPDTEARGRSRMCHHSLWAQGHYKAGRLQCRTGDGITRLCLRETAAGAKHSEAA